uniref:Uncharacterized protein n=1 Tax=Pinguiococcus pyrenoidosus TaxID=172671 RepID=A0A7R9U2L7_9STRA|mmetsp:Transcript_11815/g.43999  ORF Transcript_11815/g.43999 Transcript_11815/m.43999 type:complete len:212 (+) Transcript_11815:78-713(+)
MSARLYARSHAGNFHDDPRSSLPPVLEERPSEVAMESSPISSPFEIPNEVLAKASLSAKAVIAWTTLSPELLNGDAQLQRLIYEAKGGRGWPIPAFCSPLYCCFAAIRKMEVRKEYWLLTEDDLRIVCLGHGPGMRPPPVLSLDLRRISSMTVEEVDAQQGMTRRGLMAEFAIIRVFCEDPEIEEVEGFGLANVSSFLEAFKQRKALLQSG